MKIVEKENQIIIANSIWGAIIFGTVFVAVGLLIIFKISGFAAAPVWLGYLFLIGIFVILYASSEVIILDNNLQTISINKKSLVNKKKIDYGFGDIQSVLLQPFQDYISGTGGGSFSINLTNTKYGTQIFILFKDGKKIDLNNGTTNSYDKSFFEHNYQKNKIIGQKVASLIGVPLIENKDFINLNKQRIKDSFSGD